MWTMDKLTERTSNIAESKKEMSEELPKPLLNLPCKCHMSIALLHSSQRKRTYSRTLLCDGSPIRTKSRKAPKGSQLQDPLLPRNRKPPVYPPSLLPHNPLLCPPLMAVRLWRLRHKAAHRNRLELRSLIHSQTPLRRVAPSPLPCNLCPLCQLHQLDQKTSLHEQRNPNSCFSQERLRRVPFKNLLWYSSAHHHQLIIISSSSHHHHHHHLIIVLISSSSFPSLSLAFLFLSVLAQPSSYEKRARRNPSQGKCVFRAKKCQKLMVFCNFIFFGATLCGNLAVELRVFF